MQKRGAISPIANALPRQHTTTLAPRFCPSSKWNLQLSGRRRTGWRFTGRQWALFWTGCRRPNEPSLQPAPVTRVVPSARLYSKNIGSSDEFVGFLNMIVRKIRLAIYFRLIARTIRRIMMIVTVSVIKKPFFFLLLFCE